MRRPQTRLWALAILVLLVAAQCHLWMESGAAPARGHACRACVTLGWAVLAAQPGLHVALWALRLEAEPAPAVAKLHRCDTSAPRAPPHA